MIKNIWNHKIKNKDINSSKTKVYTDTTISNHHVCLAELECGNSVKVIKLQGNRVLIDKLKAMGIYAGTTIIKKSAIPAKGPIIVERGAMQFALGYNIAEKIIVERL